MPDVEATLNLASQSSQRAFIKTTRGGQTVEVIGTAICLDGRPEAEKLVPVIEHPNWRTILDLAPDATHMAGRLALTVDEAEQAHRALLAAREAVAAHFDASPTALAERARLAINGMLMKRSDE